jgi:DNA-binding LytR/AlgR family response regulator
MKVVIIEDEKLSAEHLTLLLQKLDNGIEVVRYLDTVKGTISALNEGLQADLFFFDIHLADGNSFEVFAKTNMEYPVIFTTAYDNYAIQAFKQNSIDYLLKPVAIKELQFAIEKFKKQQQVPGNTFLQQVARAYQELNKSYKSRFLIKKGQLMEYVPTEEISFFETQDSLSFLVTNKGNRYVIDYTMDELETLLQPKGFFRINRKIIIHITAIEKVGNYFNSRLYVVSKLLEGDARIVSRDRVSDFKQWLDN